MKKTDFLMLGFGILALAACKDQKDEITSPQSANGKNLATISVIGPNAETYTPPTRTRGTAIKYAVNFGATGNDTSDDTDAIQAAIDALPSTGGTVVIKSGTFYINADFRQVQGGAEIPGNCLRLKSNMLLKLEDGAKLKQIATDAYVAYLIYGINVSNVEISGGEIEGDRNGHLDTIGEYGHGIVLKGANHVTIRDTKVSNFWGDGVLIGDTGGSNPVAGDDIVVDNIISTNNRRQGLSLGAASNVEIWDSEFSYTNGTSPQCGIDLEPDANLYINTVHIENNLFLNNQGHGINIWNRVNDATINHNEFADNDKAGIYNLAGIRTYVAFNKIHNNGGSGVNLRDNVDDIVVVQNRFYENNGNPARPNPPGELTIVGTSVETAKDVHIEAGASNLDIRTNYYK